MHNFKNLEEVHFRGLIELMQELPKLKRKFFGEYVKADFPFKPISETKCF